MIRTETIEIAGREYTRTYSDEGYCVMDEAGAVYSEAVDVVDKAYTETDEPVPEAPEETEEPEATEGGE